MTGRQGVTFPFAGMPLLEQRGLVEELPDLGFTDLWSNETDAYDAFTPLVLASQWAPRLRVGPAIVPAFTRGPALLAQSAASLAAVAPGRFVLGVGASSDVIVERWNSIPFEEPFHRVRDTVRFLRQALAGEKVDEELETITVRGFRLAIVPSERVPILVAALRPGMLRLAGAEADGAIINWLSADDVSTVVPHVHAGGTGKEIVCRIFVLATADADEARGLGRRMIAQYLNVPVYAAFHEWLGRGERLAPMQAAWRSGDRKGALDAIPDDVVDELIVWGRPGEIRESIERYVQCGVTCPIPMVVPFGDPGQAIRDLARS